MMPLSGFVCVRNAIKLDYCIDLTIQSLLPVCNVVYVCDSDSDDGTTEMTQTWEEVYDGKLRYLNRPWSEPNGNISWLIDWMQWTQKHLPEGSHIYLDADEVLDPSGYDRIREAHKKGECLWFRRINYWGNVWQEAPHGTVCAHEVARFGPSTMKMYSDEIHDGVQFALPEPEMRVRAVRHPSLVLHHFGFCRKREALFDKVAVNLRAFFGQDQDPRLIEAMKHPEKHWTEFCPFNQPLLPALVPVPEFCKPWLQERGAL